jgi:hypothetical protein
MPELDQALAHHTFGQKLWHHQRDVIRLGGLGGLMLDDLGVGVAAVVTIFTLRRVEAADCDQPVDDAEILEDLLGSRLNTLPREPPNGLSSLSMRRNEIPRRASSIASVRPAAPAPTINTSAAKLDRAETFPIRFGFTINFKKPGQPDLNEPALSRAFPR